MCLFLSVLSGRYLSAHISLVCHSCLFCIDCYFPIFLSPRSRQLFPPCLTVVPSVCLSVCLSCLSLCDMSVFLSVSPVVPSVCLSFRLSCWSFCLFVCPSFLLFLLSVCLSVFPVCPYVCRLSVFPVVPSVCLSVRLSCLSCFFCLSQSVTVGGISWLPPPPPRREFSIFMQSREEEGSQEYFNIFFSATVGICVTQGPQFIFKKSFYPPVLWIRISFHTDPDPGS